MSTDRRPDPEAPAPAGGDDLMGPVVRQRWLGADVLSYPNRPPTILDALDRAVTRFGDRCFLIAPEGEVTYREFAELVEGAAERLAEEGIGSGDRLAVAARNGLLVPLAASAGVAIALAWPAVDGVVGRRPVRLLSATLGVVAGAVMVVDGAFAV